MDKVFSFQTLQLRSKSLILQTGIARVFETSRHGVMLKKKLMFGNIDRESMRSRIRPAIVFVFSYHVEF
jgi:hypothetical protein